MEILSLTWQNLQWKKWASFTNQQEIRDYVPAKPGLYRIHPIGENFLMYIGQTGRTLKKRFSELRRHSLAVDFPWNDPHTAAQSLWIWNKEENYSYEFSATPLGGLEQDRKGMESYLLYRYRQEFGESTLCNFGRFHKRYLKSTNKKKKNGTEGLKGRKKEDTEPDNSAGESSSSPLSPIGKPGDPNWMGLSWSNPEKLKLEKIRNIPRTTGFYYLIDSNSQNIIYIGETVDCAKRLREHNRKNWSGKELEFSYYIPGQMVLPHNLKELENDLIGNYFENFRKAPEYQFGKKR